MVGSLYLFIVWDIIILNKKECTKMLNGMKCIRVEHLTQHFLLFLYHFCKLYAVLLYNHNNSIELISAAEVS